MSEAAAHPIYFAKSASEVSTRCASSIVALSFRCCVSAGRSAWRRRCGRAWRWSSVAGPIERAFAASKLPTVAILVNSPGGSPVQSHLIFSRIRQLAKEKNKRVYVFCEDVAASGGYFLAVAGDEIYADPSSIVGSIGVISAGFGFDKLIDRSASSAACTRRARTRASSIRSSPSSRGRGAAARSCSAMFTACLSASSSERRGAKLQATDDELFNGAFWSASKALEYGLIDGIGDLRSKMQQLHRREGAAACHTDGARRPAVAVPQIAGI